MNSGHHKTIFSKRLGCLVAVGEHASSQGKANGAASGQFSGSAGTDWLSTVLQFVGVLTASCALVTLAWAGPVASTALPTSLPTGGQVAQGAASISQSGAVMNITQSTPKAVVNWNTFDIGQNAKVNIVQPGADAVMLNRVTSANPSQILGQLNANGQVVLVNPNGVLFGKDGSVNANSFTASTLGITDANFMAGNQQFERNGSTATVVNQGRINTTGGYVALLGASVSNEGQINTQGGTAYLAAAETVKIPVSGSGRIKLELSPSRINAAVANGKTGTIVTEGGQVYMQAASLSTMVASIIQSGNIDTTGEQGGAVYLLADGGQIKVDGSVKANSAGSDDKGQTKAGGDIYIGRDKDTNVLAAVGDVSGAQLESKGGFVETSGQHLETEAVTVIAKDWLLDPTNIRIVGGTTLPVTPSTSDAGAPPANTTFQDTEAVVESQIKNTTIEDALNAGTNVKISTGLASSVGTQDGNIVFDAVIVKSGGKNAKLTLEANNGITVNHRIGKAAAGTTSSDTGMLDIEMIAYGGVGSSVHAVTAANSRGIEIKNMIDANGGTVLLEGKSKSTNSDGVRFGNGAGIKAAKITVKGNATAPSPADANYSGIGFNGTNIFESTGSGASTFEGKSSTLKNTSAGIMASDAAKLTLKGNIELDGINTNTGYRGLRIGGSGGDANETTTVGNVTFKNSLENSQVLLRGKLTAEGTVSFKGGSHVNIYDGGTSITAKNGATVNLESTTVLLGDFGGTSIKTDGTAGAGFTLNINTDRLAIRTNTGTESSVNTGSGTTNISTYTSGKEILLGADDITATPTKMGLTNLELGRITGRKLVIGDMVKAGNITVSGTTTTAATTGDITLQTGGKIDVNSALTVNGSQLMLNAKGNVNVNANIVKNGTGHVVMAAGSNEAAGTATGGQVTASAGKTVSNANGNIYIYSGSAGNSAGLAGLNAAFLGGFKVSGDANQNTDTFVAFPVSGVYGITGSTSKAQVMFREKMAINLGSLTGATIKPTYGDDATRDTDADRLNLLGMVQNELISVNGLSGQTLDVSSGSGVIKINKDVVVKSMTGNLTSPTYSGSGYLNATDSSNYAYGALTSAKYNVPAIAAGNTQVMVNKANLTQVLATKVYDGLLTVKGSEFDAIKGVKGETFTASGGTAVISGKDVAGDKSIDDLSGLVMVSTNGGAASNYNLSSGLPAQGANNKVVINKADLVLRGERYYNGTTKVAGSTLKAYGAGDEYFIVAGDGDDSNLINKKATLNGGVTGLQSVDGLSLSTAFNYAVTDNYKSISLAKSEYTVNKLALTGSIAQGQTTYGADLVAGVVTFTNKLDADVVNANGVAFNTAGNTSTSGKLKASDTAYVGIQSVSGLTGTDAGNYTFANVKGDYKVDRLALAGSIDGVITTYGTNAGTGSVNLIGVIGPDNVSASAAGLVGTALSSSGNLKAGTYVQSVVGGLTGTDAGNYNFSGTSSANYVVNKLALNTQIAAVSTTYGTTAATGAASITGVLSGDKVDLANAKATLVDAANSSSGNLNAGTYKQTVANSLSGADADNYTAAPTSLANYVVTPKAITATVTAADKVYDGSNVATLTANSADIVSGDLVAVQGASGTFASKNVARDGSGNAVAQTVTVSGTGVGLGGTDGANYTLTNATSIASTTAKITPKDLSVSGITASDKVYDGSTAAVINTANAVVSGLVTGDSVSVSTQSGVGNFASKDVAFDGAGVVASQAVTVSGLSLNGAAAGNYNVSDKSGATAKVLQRALSITGSVAQDKTVDGNTNAQVKPGQLVNLVAGESLVVSATGQFADAEIGTNKAVTTQYALANGANGVARNYTLAGEVLRAAILVASINPVQPIVNPSRTGGGGRVVVSGSGNSGAALGVADGEEEIISREECSVLNPEKCECQESTIAGVEMCFAPTLAANTKN